MSDSGSKQTRADIPFALVVTGLGIGWLAGLSVSPVVSIVLTSVTGVVATIVAALSGVKDEFIDLDASPTMVRRFLNAVTPIPLAWLVGGLILGSIAGIGARNYNLLGPKPATVLTQEVDKWTAYGLDEEIVARRLFEAQYGYRGWLGQDLTLEVTQWATDTTKLETAEVARRIFESTYPLESASAAVGNPSTRVSEPDVIGFTALKSVEAQLETRELCKVARESPGSTLRSYVDTIVTMQQVISLTHAITDDQMLKGAIAVLCTDG